MSARLRIERLAAQGDGVAKGERGPVYVPFALPGELVNAAVAGDRGTLVAVLEPSADRVEPACRHFGECGSCALQHLAPAAYRDWKREKLVQALHHRGLEAPVDDLVPCQPASRRRAALTARKTHGGLILGYNRSQSHQIIDIAECPVLEPAIVAALPILRELATGLCSTDKPFRVAVTLSETGLDVALEGAGRPSEKKRRAAVEFALLAGLARLSLDGEVLVAARDPGFSPGGTGLVPPPGGFLQAVAAIEEGMAAMVTGHLSPAKRLADLFSGIGTFALRLAHVAEVHAVESDGAALAALDRAFRFGAGLKKVTTERRDLFRRPLTAKELDRFGGLVFDPPRAGAEAQARQIASSNVPLVAAVSCNPATLARDLRILVDGGYLLKKVTPFDQFLWSPHVEAVALLEKPRRRR